MRRRLLSLLSALLMAIGLALPLPATASAPDATPAVGSSLATELVSTQYAPLIPSNASLTPSFPATLDVSLPFVVLDSIDANPALKNGKWYFGVYRVDAGKENGGWDMVLFQDEKGNWAAAAVGQVTTSDGREEALQVKPNAVGVIGRVCSSRIIAHFVAPDAERYMWCAPSTSGRATTLHIERRPS